MRLLRPHLHQIRESGVSFEKLTQFYAQLSEVSVQTQEPHRLASPDKTVTVMSPVCGSRLTLDVRFDGPRIAALGFELEACALTRAALASVLRHAPGKTLPEIQAIEKSFRFMLENGGPPPEGEWADLAILAPAKDFPARHDSMMLPFEAISRAYDEKP